MFFMAGVYPRQKKLELNQTMICSQCGKYGRYEIIMEYMNLSVFFIPVLKWNKKFYVKSTCCGSTYTISKELGESMARGEDVTLTEQDLELVRKGEFSNIKRCTSCGFETYEDFQYCPKCSAVLK
jgi:hypothetical protein